MQIKCVEELLAEKAKNINRFKFKVNNRLYEYSDHYNFVICCDKKLVNQLYVLIYSIYHNLNYKEINIYILHSSFDKVTEYKLREWGGGLNINIHIVKCEKEEFYGFNVQRLPIETYFYLNSHNIIPADEDRALVLDVDTMVLKNIDDFYNLDFENQYLIAGPEYDDVPYSHYLEILEGKRQKTPGFIRNEEMCFNSGVLLMNLKKMRDENITIESFRKCVFQEDIGGFYHDQLVINRFAQGSVKFFPRLFFNMSPVTRSAYIIFFKRMSGVHETYLKNEILSDYVDSIVHFCGRDSIKPWDVRCKIHDDKIEIINDIIPEQNKYLQKWWELALKIPKTAFFELAK